MINNNWLFFIIFLKQKSSFTSMNNTDWHSDSWMLMILHCEDNGDGGGEEDHNSNHLFWSDEVKIRLFFVCKHQQHAR